MTEPLDLHTKTVNVYPDLPYDGKLLDFIITLRESVPEDKLAIAEVNYSPETDFLTVSYERPETAEEALERHERTWRQQAEAKARLREQYETLKAMFEGNRK